MYDVCTMNVFERIISVVAPHSCVVCDREGSLMCVSCVWSLGSIAPDRCFRCNKLSADSKTCSSCRSVSGLNHVWIRSLYKDTAKEIIHRLKFERSIAATENIASAMFATLPDSLSGSIIVPIPTATSRKRQRGYDQSVLIANKISRLSGLPVYPHLVRLGQSRQVGSKKADRIIQLQGSYIVTRPNKVSGRHILLVDDVMTTGATLEAAANVLRKAGAKRVDVVVFARA